MPLIQGSTPWGDIISGVLSAGAQYVHGAEQAKQQKAAQDRQAAIDEQNRQLTALSIGNQKAQMLSNGTNPDGTPAVDPYMQSRQGQPAVPDEMGGIPAKPAATTPYNINDNIAALNAAHQYAVAQHLQQQSTANNAQTTFNNQQTTFQQGQDDRDSAAATAAALGAFQKGLQYPPNWNKLNADQQIAYLQQRQNAAQQHGDKQTFDQTSEQIKAIQGPQNLADRLQAQRDMLTQKLQSADALQSARLIAALGRIGQGHELTQFQIQELANHDTDKKTEADRFALTHNADGSPKSNRQDSVLSGQVVSLRKAVDDYVYNNKLDIATPQGRAKIQAFVGAGGYSPDAIRQVVPFAAPAAAPASTPQNNAPPAPKSKFVPGRLYQDAKGNKARYNADGSWTPQ